MFIGIDVGGMSIKAGVVNGQGKIISSHSVKTPLSGNDDFLKAMLEAIKEALSPTDVNPGDIISIGIGYPGAVDRENGILLSANNVPGTNIPVRSYLNKIYPDAYICVDNDANCAALGEYYYSEDAKDFVFVTLGTGIGGGIIINSKLYAGMNGVGGELGHIVTHHDGKLCSCGRKGCWEAYASVTALKSLTEENRSKIKSIKDSEEISGKTVFEYAQSGDEDAIRVRDSWIEEVAIGITDIVNIFQPHEIVIGGAISKEGEVLLSPIRKYAEKFSYDVGPHKRTRILASRIGGDAGIIGAAFLYKNKKIHKGGS